MYDERLEQLIDAALADGVLTEKEKQVLFKKAQALGVDLDEFEMVLDARLVKLQKAEAEKAASSAPKSNKYGDVKKCPACGAMVQSYQGICPECGYAFEGVEANAAVKELSNLLQKETDTQKMIKIIDNYPIPLDKASLLSFITWIRPQCTDANNPLANSYYKKYAECINKIKVSFANDKDLLPFVAHLAADEKIIRKQKIYKFTLRNIWFWIGLAILVTLVIILGPKPLHKSVKRSSVAIENALKKGDTQKAINIYLSFEGSKHNRKPALADAAMSIIETCLAEDNLDDAIRIGNSADLEYRCGYSEKKASIASRIYDYCISHGNFEKAKEIMSTDSHSWNQAENNYKYIKDVVIYLCDNGRKDEAQRFLNNHKGEINDVKDIQDIIKSY